MKIGKLMNKVSGFLGKLSSKVDENNPDTQARRSIKEIELAIEGGEATMKEYLTNLKAGLEKSLEN